MKKKRKSLFRLLLISYIIICISNYASGQGKFDLSFGFGFPEMINTGLKYEHNDTQFGFSTGFLKVKSANFFTLEGAIYYHFAGTSPLSERRPWYGRAGLLYLRYEEKYWIDNYVGLNTRIGRELYFSEKIGITIDIGVLLVLIGDSKRKPISGFDDQESIWLPRLIPSLGFNLFFRL